MDPNQLLEKLKNLGGALTMAQRVSLGAAFLFVVLLVGGSTYWMQRTDYVLLFADMNPEAASDVITRLKNDKVDYQLDDGGRAVRVPAARVDELRLSFASEGLPSSGRIGFEIFDRTAFGATEFLEQVNYRRALEGEIARSITTLSEVSGARVHIAMAKQSLFASREQPAKASVVLKLKGNRPLSAATIQGITNLVASSVEGLRADAVVVLDSFGRPLARPSLDGDEPLGAAQMERQQQIERDLTNKVLALLEPVVGQEGVRVNVSARLDTASEESTEEKWDPLTRAVRSRQVSGDVAAIAKAQGIAGTRANLPGPAPAGDPAAATTPAAAADAVAPPPDEEPIAGRGSETTNFEISRTTRHTVRPRGSLARLSIAVILDNEAVVSKTAEGAVSRTTKPRSPESLQKIQALVGAAVGLDPARGDHLTVENVPFEGPIVEDPPTVTTWQRIAPKAYEGARFLVPLVLGLVTIFFVIRPLLARATGANAPAALPAVSEARPRTVQDLEGEIEAQLDAALAEKNAENRKLPVLSRRLATLTTKEPEHAARLLRMWMSEEGR